MNRIICELKTIWQTVTSFIQTGDATPIVGHTFVNKEVHKNKVVLIDECKDCGKVDISWMSQEMYEQEKAQGKI